MSLPLAFSSDSQSIPSFARYIQSDPQKVAQWRTRLGAQTRPRVGIAWAGSAVHKEDRNRSIALTSLMPLLTADCEFVSLQKEICTSDREALQHYPHLRHFGDEPGDFTDTAALCELMDVVISVDTSVAHLAGALGKPVWILLPFSPDWRWLLERTDSPWYPGAKLYRQEKIGDWTAVISRVNLDLTNIAPMNDTSVNIPTLFARAFALHQQGKLSEAATLYEKIITVQPAHFDALQLLGVIAAQTRDYPSAIDRLTDALKIRPDHAATYNNRGIAFKELRQLDAAIADYSQALALKPDYADAWYNRGIARKELDQLDAAVADYHHAIECKPDFAEAHNNLGVALQALRQFDAAVASYERAIAIRPDYAEAHNNRGNVLRELGQPGQPGLLDTAVASFDRAVAIRPDYAEAWYNRGNALMDQKQPDAAINSHDRAIAIRPDYADAFNNRGNALRELGQLDAAVASYDRAIAIKPDHAEAFNNRGNALKDRGEQDKAIADYERAIAVNPDYAEAYNNRGAAWQDLLQLDAAEDSCARAIAIKPDFAAAHWNLGCCRLLRGDFARGFPGYEWRWKMDEQSIAADRHFPQPLWLGDAPLAGKTILLHAEQGLGDTLQFCRYAKLVASRGARVILEVQQPLRQLLRNLEGVSQLIVKDDVLPPFDYQCPLMSLPLAFGTDLQSIPAPASDIRSDAEQKARWQVRLGNPTRPRIGIAWSGNAGHKNDRNRSIALAGLAPLLALDGEFFSLQKEVRECDREALLKHPNLRHFGDELTDFTDTAALCELMDIVISADTSVAHLAGTLGRPVWIMLPFRPDWRWMIERTDSPWYPAARLYRQKRIGDWAGVIEHVRVDLASTFSQEMNS